MTSEIPPARTKDAHFGVTKLVVHDLHAAHEFYSEACGLVEVFRYDSEIAGRPITEIGYAPTSEGGASFALIKFLDRDKPETGEQILGFTTDNIENFVARAETAGGRVTDPIREMPDLNLRVAFVEDGEGHLIEVVQML
jgi:catechol 2,3-dioxygenase-like lactoylglutathione lyase family enzyme